MTFPPVLVVGLGLMGGAIAANLVRAGYRVLGYDPNSDARHRAAATGVELLEGLLDLPLEVEVVITSLPSSEALHETVQSLRTLSGRNFVVAELSTLLQEAKEYARRCLLESGIAMLDCPISGTGAQALEADLSVYVSGDREVWERVAATFAAFSRRPRFVGDFGNGTRLKYIANLLVAVHNVASAEAMALAEAAGLDLDATVEILREGAGNSRIFELRAPMMARGSYAPASMKLEVWQKDMDLIEGFARSSRAWTPLFDVTRDIYATARVQRPLEDTAAVFEVVRRDRKFGGAL